MKHWFFLSLEMGELVVFVNKHNLVPGEVVVLRSFESGKFGQRIHIMYYAEKELV